jgi:hypothetical protein
MHDLRLYLDEDIRLAHREYVMRFPHSLVAQAGRVHGNQPATSRRHLRTQMTLGSATRTTGMAAFLKSWHDAQLAIAASRELRIRIASTQAVTYTN